jgi:hypothetical protein
MAVEIQVSDGAANGIESLLTSPFMMMGALANDESRRNGPPADAFAALTAVWTNGSLLRMDGIGYYVTYGYALSSAISAAEPPSVLKLKLIRVDFGHIRASARKPFSGFIRFRAAG